MLDHKNSGHNSDEEGHDGQSNCYHFSDLERCATVALALPTVPRVTVIGALACGFGHIAAKSVPLTRGAGHTLTVKWSTALICGVGHNSQLERGLAAEGARVNAFAGSPIAAASAGFVVARQEVPR